jgi:hypothetical protein
LPRALADGPMLGFQQPVNTPPLPPFFDFLPCGIIIPAAHRSMPVPLARGRDVDIFGREMVMIDKHELCDKIRHLYPDVGECGIDVDADYDPAQKSWVVRLEKGSFKLKTYLEDGDAETCMLGRKCIGLGIEIAQLRANIERLKDA